MKLFLHQEHVHIHSDYNMPTCKDTSLDALWRNYSQFKSICTCMLATSHPIAITLVRKDRMPDALKWIVSGLSACALAGLLRLLALWRTTFWLQQCAGLLRGILSINLLNGVPALDSNWAIILVRWYFITSSCCLQLVWSIMSSEWLHDIIPWGWLWVRLIQMYFSIKYWPCLTTVSGGGNFLIKVSSSSSHTSNQPITAPPAF